MLTIDLYLHEDNKADTFPDGKTKLKVVLPEVPHKGSEVVLQFEKTSQAYEVRTVIWQVSPTDTKIELLLEAL